MILACRRLKRRWRAEKEEEGEKEGEDGEEEQEEEDMWHDAEDEVWQDVEDEVWEDAKEEKGAEEEEEEALQARRARIVTAPSGQGENIEPASGPSRDQSSKEADKKKTRPPRPARVIHEIRFSAEDKASPVRPSRHDSMAAHPHSNKGGVVANPTELPWRVTCQAHRRGVPVHLKVVQGTHILVCCQQCLGCALVHTP